MNRYRLTRIKVPNEQSAEHFKENEGEFTSELDLHNLMFTVLVRGQKFYAEIGTKEKARCIITSRIVNVYQMDEDTVGFDTKSGSRYQITLLK